MKSSHRSSSPVPSASTAEEVSVYSSPNGLLATQTVLLAVTGMSPPVLTETIWALAHEPEPIIPHRIIVVTTAAGRQELERQLFQANPAFGATPWDALRKALAEEGHDLAGRLRFGTTADDIRVITKVDPSTHQSCELSDLRSPLENEAAADFLLEQVRGLVENPDTHIIASLAGGRKTMGALLYACFTLIARESDRLTHVLVSEPFDAVRGFYFPAQPGGALSDREGASIDPAEAVLELADVPFVPLRNLFMRDLGQPAGTFRRLVSVCQANVRRSAGENLRIEIESRKTVSFINHRPLELAPREHLVLFFFACRTKQGDTVLSAYDECLVELEEFRLKVRQEAPDKDWSDWRASESLNRSFDVRDLTRILSDIRTKAKRAGGDAAFLASLLPEKGRCGLGVPPSLIFLK